MRVWTILMAALLATLGAGPLACAQEALIPPERHAWAKFPIGSWKRMKVTRETYDERGVPTISIEEIKTTIVGVSENNYKLLGEHTTEFGGRKLLQSSQEVVYGYSGEKNAETVESIKNLGERELVLNGRKILCEVRQAIILGEDMSRTAVTVHYSRDVFPHALKREFGAPGDGAAAATVEQVISVGMPYQVLQQPRSAAFVLTRQKLPTYSRETMEVTCDDVPGGIVDQWRKEIDSSGKLLRRLTFELVDYQAMEPARVPVERQGVFDRKRARRGEEKSQPPMRRRR